MVDESENQNVDEAVVPADDSQVVQERQGEDSVEQQRQRNDVEYNWAEARRKMNELDRKVREQDDYIARIHKQITPQEDEIDEVDRLAEDDIITKSQAKRLAEKMVKQSVDNALRARDASTVEERVKSKFSDFDEIVTRENIEYLRKQDPELAETLSYNPDPYKQAVAVYNTLKRMGVNGEKSKAPLEREKALKNSQKPLSVNAIAKNSAIGNVHLFENGLTPELKSQLRKEMEECRKRG